MLDEWWALWWPWEKFTHWSVSRHLSCDDPLLWYCEHGLRAEGLTAASQNQRRNERWDQSKKTWKCFHTFHESFKVPVLQEKNKFPEPMLTLQGLAWAHELKSEKCWHTAVTRKSRCLLDYLKDFVSDFLETFWSCLSERQWEAPFWAFAGGLL